MEDEFLESISDLEPEEIAVLQFTAGNLGNDRAEQNSPILVPTKDAVFWAICSYEIAKRSTFLDEDVESYFGGSISQRIRLFINSKMDFFDAHRKSLSRYTIPLSHYEDLFGFKRNTISTAKIQRFKAIEKQLEDKGLIRDPFGLEIPGATIVILGAIPYSFSIQTDEGNRRCISISAWLWDFNMQFVSKENFNLRFKVNVARSAALIKRHMSNETRRIDEEQK